MAQQHNPEIPPWLNDQCRRLVCEDEMVQNLNLNIRRLRTVPEMEALIDALQKNSSIQVLNLVTTLVENEAILQLLVRKVLKNHPSLHSLFLSYNKLHNLHGIGRALATNNVLRILSLEYNQISFYGAEAIASGLSTNTCLEQLQLNNNDIWDKGVVFLAQALMSNTSLQRLGVRCNKTGGLAIEALESMLLEGNCTIFHIEFDIRTGRYYDKQKHNSANAVATRKRAANIQRLCQANRFGRRLVMMKEKQLSSSETSFPDSLLPLILYKARGHPDVIYWWMTEKLDLIEDTTTCAP